MKKTTATLPHFNLAFAFARQACLNLVMVVVLGLVGCAHQSRNGDRTDRSNSAHGGRIAGLDPELSTYSYPFPVSFFTFESQKQSMKMAYMDVVPTKANGQTIVLLHGKNFASNYWEQTANLLAQHGYRVVMPDQIGFGKSSKPEFYQFSFNELAHNTLELMNSLGVSKFTVLGHSMGGMLAVRLALMYPLKVEGLILLNPLGLEDLSLSVPSQTVDELYRGELQKTTASFKAYESENYFAGEWRPEYDRLLEIPAGWIENPDYNLIAWNAALTSEMIFTEPVLYAFSHLNTRVLLIIGQRDRSAPGKELLPAKAAEKLGDYPVLGKKAARAIAGAQLIEISGSGHAPQIDAFPQFAEALLRFLSEKPLKH